MQARSLSAAARRANWLHRTKVDIEGGTHGQCSGPASRGGVRSSARGHRARAENGQPNPCFVPQRGWARPSATCGATPISHRSLASRALWTVALTVRGGSSGIEVQGADEVPDPWSRCGALDGVTARGLRHGPLSLAGLLSRAAFTPKGIGRELQRDGTRRDFTMAIECAAGPARKARSSRTSWVCRRPT